MARRLVVTLAPSATKRSMPTCRSTSARSRKPGVVLHRREHFGVEDRADALRDVVVHRLRIDDAVAFAEDDVAFEVQFERDVFGFVALALR